MDIIKYKNIFEKICKDILSKADVGSLFIKLDISEEESDDGIMLYERNNNSGYSNMTKDGILLSKDGLYFGYARDEYLSTKTFKSFFDLCNACNIDHSITEDEIDNIKDIKFILLPNDSYMTLKISF